MQTRTRYSSSFSNSRIENIKRTQNFEFEGLRWRRYEINYRYQSVFDFESWDANRRYFPRPEVEVSHRAQPSLTGEQWMLLEVVAAQSETIMVPIDLWFTPRDLSLTLSPDRSIGLSHLWVSSLRVLILAPRRRRPSLAHSNKRLANPDSLYCFESAGNLFIDLC